MKTGRSTSAQSLPDDLQREQSLRIQLFYAIGVALWAINFTMDVGLAPNGDRGPYRLLIEALGAALAAAIVVFTRYSRASMPLKVHVAVAGIVPHAFALALLNSWTEQPTTMRAVSPTTVLILFFGIMAIDRPRRMLAAALAAASMDLVGVWVAHRRGLPVPPVLNTIAMFYPNYLCAILAVAPSYLVYRLAGKLRQARALGSYELVERLGAGGMGEVWRARHHLLARSAAIKLVRPEMLGVSGSNAAMMLHRFRREAQATAALSSPNTIRLFDFGVTDEGSFYYVMELLDGLDLETLVREFGPLPPARAMHLVRQISRSLAEAHAKGLIHRDIKPANIYVCRMGLEYDFIKVLDFGLVKFDSHHEETMATAPSVTMGTPGYMAPELILGRTTVDAGVDVYAVGCVAYYLLTGQHVFTADSPMKVLLRHVQDTPVPPSHCSPGDIPREVDDFVLACLQKDPNHRPQDARELSHLVEHVRTGDTWQQRAAAAWWAGHLPALTAPAPVVMPEWQTDHETLRVAVACAR